MLSHDCTRCRILLDEPDIGGCPREVCAWPDGDGVLGKGEGGDCRFRWFRNGAGGRGDWEVNSLFL